MDEFKKHIQQNFHLIEEDEIPNSKVWNRIKTSINDEKKVVAIGNKSKIISILKYAVAASVIGLAVVGAIHILSNKTQPIIETVSVEPSKKTDTTHSNLQVNTVEVDTPLAVIQTVAKNVIKVVTYNIISDDTINNLVGINPSNNDVAFVQIKSIDSQYNQVIALQKKAINNTPVYAENVAYFKSFAKDFKQMENDEKQVKKDIAAIGFNNDLLNQLINVYQQKLDLLKMFQAEINKTNIRFKQNRNNIDSSKIYFVSI